MTKLTITQRATKRNRFGSEPCAWQGGRQWIPGSWAVRQTHGPAEQAKQALWLGPGGQTQAANLAAAAPLVSDHGMRSAGQVDAGVQAAAPARLLATIGWDGSTRRSSKYEVNQAWSMPRKPPACLNSATGLVIPRSHELYLYTVAACGTLRHATPRHAAQRHATTRHDMPTRHARLG